MPKAKKVTLKELANHLSGLGIDVSLEGDADKVIRAVNTLEEATAAELSFLSNPKYERFLGSTRAGAVIIGKDITSPQPLTLVRTDQPYAALMASVVLIYGYRQHPQWSIHPTATISKTAKIGAGASVGPQVTVEEDVIIGEHAVLYPGCYIGRHTHIGDNAVFYPNVVIYEECTIGNNVTLHAGSVIGEDGLGYAAVGEQWNKIPQVGYVVIEDNVEIGANCTIDRATLGTTVIGRGSKFSNLVAIGHGTKIGSNAMFVAQVGLAGSVTVGKHVQMGGQVGVAGHVAIGDNATIGAKAGVANDVESGAFVLGQPAIKASEAKRSISLTQKLPEMRQRLKALEQEVAELREALITASSATPPSR